MKIPATRRPDRWQLPATWPQQLSDRLRQRGETPELSRRYRSIAAVPLAYGRHRGPAPVRARRAAVLVGIYEDVSGTNGVSSAEGLHGGSMSQKAAADALVVPDAHQPLTSLRHMRVLLTRRPSLLKHHGGQICFPGGRVESGEDTREAALREFAEELGRPALVRQWIGRLACQYVYASDNRVTPWVAWLHKDPTPWCPDPAEVDEVLDLPLETLLRQVVAGNLSRHTEIRSVRRGEHRVGHLQFRTPAFAHGEHKVWGATAMILDELAQHLLTLSDVPVGPAN
ncbi:NUDIX hydrolase [Crateriforma conspicua]|uniref:NUDIX hydrolase n=1 Tax=Crateriforma TaxID=2714592 RepID=UPI0018CCB56F|nr:CoA pyrophosphatase [Crateriforma conspicua]